MLFKTSIKSKVMKVIANKIKEAQKAHDEELARIKSNYKSNRIVLLHNLEMDLKNLLELHKDAEVKIAEKHVNLILSKII